MGTAPTTFGLRIAVIGGGIAGLAAAHFAATSRPDATVTVYEQSERVGGKLALGQLAGSTVDIGAEAILARRPEGLELLEAAGLGADRVSPSTTSATIWTPQGPRSIPSGTSMGVPGDVDAARTSALFDEQTIQALAQDRDTSHDPVEDDVAVGELVARRVGDQVVDRLVDPLLGGVYAGRARELSLQATMPALAAALRQTGSLVEAAHLATTSGHRATAAAGHVFAGISGGIGRLPVALAATGAFGVEVRTPVRGLRRTPTGFTLLVGAVPDQREVEADAVIVTTPAGKAAGLLKGVAPTATPELAAIRTASVAIVSVAVERTETLTLPAGSGMLVPASTPSAVKGVTISSQKWPGAPAELAFIRASIGRIGEEHLLQCDDAQLITRATADLGVLLSTPIRPVDAIVTRWGGGLPQYDVGHLQRVETIKTAVAAVPGLAVAGASYDGLGIPACIASGRRAVEQVLASVAARVEV